MDHYYRRHTTGGPAKPAVRHSFHSLQRRHSTDATSNRKTRTDPPECCTPQVFLHPMQQQQTQPQQQDREEHDRPKHSYSLPRLYNQNSVGVGHYQKKQQEPPTTNHFENQGRQIRSRHSFHGGHQKQQQEPPTTKQFENQGHRNRSRHSFHGGHQKQQQEPPTTKHIESQVLNRNQSQNHGSIRPKQQQQQEVPPTTKHIEKQEHHRTRLQKEPKSRSQQKSCHRPEGEQRSCREPDGRPRIPLEPEEGGVTAKKTPRRVSRATELKEGGVTVTAKVPRRAFARSCNSRRDPEPSFTTAKKKNGQIGPRRNSNEKTFSPTPLQLQPQRRYGKRGHLSSSAPPVSQQYVTSSNSSSDSSSGSSSSESSSSSSESATVESGVKEDYTPLPKAKADPKTHRKKGKPNGEKKPNSAAETAATIATTVVEETTNNGAPTAVDDCVRKISFSSRTLQGYKALLEKMGGRRKKDKGRERGASPVRSEDSWASKRGGVTEEEKMNGDMGEQYGAVEGVETKTKQGRPSGGDLVRNIFLDGSDSESEVNDELYDLGDSIGSDADSIYSESTSEPSLQPPPSPLVSLFESSFFVFESSFVEDPLSSPDDDEDDLLGKQIECLQRRPQPQPQKTDDVAINNTANLSSKDQKHIKKLQEKLIKDHLQSIKQRREMIPQRSEDEVIMEDEVNNLSYDGRSIHSEQESASDQSSASGAGNNSSIFLSGMMDSLNLSDIEFPSDGRRMF